VGYVRQDFELRIVYSVEECVAPVARRATWNIPTLREDGTPLPAEEVAGYVVYIDDLRAGEVAGTSWPVPSDVPNGALMTVATVDTDGLEGDASDPVTL
jgi:hypothetical protein